MDTVNIISKHDDKGVPRLAPSLPARKQHHLEACLKESTEEIESRPECGFESVQFIHTALPELSADAVDISITFLNKKIALPLFISCMTGGSEKGYLANVELAKAAQRSQVPLGLGSVRVLFEHPERAKDFRMRTWAPDVPLMANLGAVQARDLPALRIKELVHSLECDALVLHLNCGQELFQKGGDRNFLGLFDAIGRIIDSVGLPVIVKETGFGIRPKQISQLLSLGVHYVDVAGAGGTNWILVEKSCQNANSAAEEFSNWGIPTPVLLDTAQKFKGKILASGGLRSGMDLAKSLALGALAGGMALPFIRAAAQGGTEAIEEEIVKIGKVLQAVLALTGLKSVEELRGTPLIKSTAFEHYVTSLKKIDSL